MNVFITFLNVFSTFLKFLMLKKIFSTFLPRDAMLARYILSSRLHLSVCYKLILYRNDWTHRAGFGMEASFHLSHTVL